MKGDFKKKIHEAQATDCLGRNYIFKPFDWYLYILT